ncbi:MAG: acetate/propionate family kinase [Solirubrobacteraceae bacterium]
MVNAGSSSVKLRIVDGVDELVCSQDLGAPDDHLPDHLDDFLHDAGAPDVVGHRVVHGGSRFTGPVLVDAEVREALDGLSELAPLHNPPALAGIDAARRLLVGIPQVACFDTGFHAGLPAVATSYAVPREWVSRWGIRRYGFHGLSCAWAAQRAAAMLDQSVDRLRLVICHLGAGASATALTGGRSVDTTMGFTPLEGLVMATRCGDLDPGALLFALGHGLAVGDASDALEHRSGLLGLCGGSSSDMRALLSARAEGDEPAGLAIGVYLHRLRAKIAAMAAATAGTDALIFTGGIGERSGPIRAETCAELEWLGVTLDESANDMVADRDADISAPGAIVRTLVVHAREDLQIAHECRQLLGNDRGHERSAWAVGRRRAARRLRHAHPSGPQGG